MREAKYFDAQIRFERNGVFLCVKKRSFSGSLKTPVLAFLSRLDNVIKGLKGSLQFSRLKVAKQWQFSLKCSILPNSSRPRGLGL